MDNKQLRKACIRVNDRLYQLGLLYQHFIPIQSIDAILSEAGFNETEPAIYCGADGASHEHVGHNKYLSLTWHKMESGRYEIVAYLN